jgi:hypothetical protein
MTISEMKFLNDQFCLSVRSQLSHLTFLNLLTCTLRLWQHSYGYQDMPGETRRFFLSREENLEAASSDN